MDSALNCYLCAESYNKANKLPRFLACGHTYCSECCGIILEQVPCLCPEDNFPISYSKTEEIPMNVALLKLIEKPNLCADHKKKLDYVCINCKSKICSHCALMGGHKEHEIKAMEDVHADVAMRTGCLLDMLEIIDKTEAELSDSIMIKLEEVANLYNKKRTEIEKNVKHEFDVMRTQLDALEKNVLETLEKHFDNIENVIVGSREFPKVIYKQAGEWKDMARDLLDLIDAKTEDPSFILFKMLASGYLELFQAGEKLLTDLEGIKDIKIEKISDDIQSLGIEFTRNVIPTLCRVVFRSQNSGNNKISEDVNITEFKDYLQENENLS